MIFYVVVPVAYTKLAAPLTEIVMVAVGYELAV
jgi:hypothetical protein